VTDGRRIFAAGAPMGFDAQRVAMRQWTQYAAARQAQCDAVIAAIARVMNQPATKEP
jgi:hypothetical protein